MSHNINEDKLISAFKEELKVCHHLGDVYLTLNDYSKGLGELTIDINGWYEKEETFSINIDDVKKFFAWLETVLENSMCKSEFEFKDSRRTHHNFLLGYCPYTYFKEELTEYNNATIELTPISECALWYLYDTNTTEITLAMVGHKEDTIARIYTCIKKNKNLRLISVPIRSHFMSRENATFKYKGYKITSKISKYDFRYYGDIYPENCEGKPKARGGIASDNLTEFEHHFQNRVEGLVRQDKWKIKDNEWRNSGIDIDSIIAVFDMQPETFRKRLETKKYDESLNEIVPGGHYEVPLPYVTKAWDYILKGDLDRYSFWVEYDPDDDDEPVIRTLDVAIKNNDEIKSLWKEFYGIDVDNLEVDFSHFDKHLPPNMDEDDSYEYFTGVPDGVIEWILDGILNPYGRCHFDYVSCLMELAEYIKRERALPKQYFYDYEEE